MWGEQEAVRELVRVGPVDGGTNRGVARAHGASGPDDRRVHGGYSGPLDSRSDDGFHGGTQQPVLGCEAKGPPVRDREMHDRHAILRRQANHPTVLLTCSKQSGTLKKI